MALRNRLPRAGFKSLKAAVVKSYGGEHLSQAPGTTWWIEIRETNRPEPLLTRRNPETVVETKGVSITWDKFAKSLVIEQVATGV